MYGHPVREDHRNTQKPASSCKRVSIKPTYDSRETGPRYSITTTINGRVLEWQKPIEDPFVRQVVHVGWRDLLRGLLHRDLVVEVRVDGDRDVVEDVLELDGNYLGTNCTRRDEFNTAVLSGTLGDYLGPLPPSLSDFEENLG
jgi:hypothetical protein